MHVRTHTYISTYMHSAAVDALRQFDRSSTQPLRSPVDIAVLCPPPFTPPQPSPLIAPSPPSPAPITKVLPARRRRRLNLPPADAKPKPRPRPPISTPSQRRHRSARPQHLAHQAGSPQPFPPLHLQVKGKSNWDCITQSPSLPENLPAVLLPGKLPSPGAHPNSNPDQSPYSFFRRAPATSSNPALGGSEPDITENAFSSFEVRASHSLALSLPAPVKGQPPTARPRLRSRTSQGSRVPG